MSATPFSPSIHANEIQKLTQACWRMPERSDADDRRPEGCVGTSPEISMFRVRRFASLGNERQKQSPVQGIRLRVNQEFSFGINAILPVQTFPKK
jgi:hypothetical protein